MREAGATNDDLLGLLIESNFRYSQEQGGSKNSGMTKDDVIEECKLFYFARHETTSALLTWTMVVLGMHPNWQASAREEVLQVFGKKNLQGNETGRFLLPPGVQLLLPLLFIHHDPEFWGEDAGEFNPERFASGVAKAPKIKGAFFPFGGGPRICVGQNFAMMEAKMALATILQHFSFETSSSYAHAPCTVITLHPQHGAQLILHRL